VENVWLELEWLVVEARPRDALFFHYSGHGLQLLTETLFSSISFRSQERMK
jgi:hypothetical protein